jgi:ATP-binding protein involved in chromosome partitioning
MAIASREAILAALSQVKHPILERDIVSLDLIQELTVSEGKASLKLAFGTPLTPSVRETEKRVREAIAGLPGVTDVEVISESRIRKGRVADGKGAVPGIANIIAVSSGKGGVGKSTVAVNLAIALAGYGAAVGLLDTDVYGPNVPIMVGIDREPSVNHQKLVPHVAYGVKVMSLGFLNRGDKPVVWRGPMLHTAVRQFLFDVEWGELDYLIVDMPPGTGDAQLSLAQLVPVQGAVLVTTPQEVALGDVRKAINMFAQVHIPLIGIVENMSYFVCTNCSAKHEIFGSGGGQSLAATFRTSLLGQVPLSIDIRAGGDTGQPIVVAAPDGRLAESFRQIADNVAARVSLFGEEGSGLPIIDMTDSRGDRFVV